MPRSSSVVSEACFVFHATRGQASKWLCFCLTSEHLESQLFALGLAGRFGVSKAVSRKDSQQSIVFLRNHKQSTRDLWFKIWNHVEYWVNIKKKNTAAPNLTLRVMEYFSLWLQLHAQQWHWTQQEQSPVLGKKTENWPCNSLSLFGFLSFSLFLFYYFSGHLSC